MGAQLRFGTAGATGGGWSAQSGTVQPAMCEGHHAPLWQWQCRAPKTWRDRNRWVSAWPRGWMSGGGAGWGTDGMAPIGAEHRGAGFEPFSCDGEGTSVSRFIKGTTKDSGGTAVANATVQAFRTSDDFYLGQDVSREDGTYTCPADVPAGTQCYLVAYKAGSPDIAGTTVNTITNTDVAGN